MRAFISYAHTPPDQDLAAWLKERLPAATGLQAVLDRDSIAHGVPFHGVIHSLLRDCDFLFFLWSGTSINAPYCDDELRAAFKHGLLIIPVRLERDLREHYLLSQYSDIPFDGDNAALLDRIKNRLAHLETPEGRIPVLQHVLMQFRDRVRRPGIDKDENERNIATLEERLADARQQLRSDSLANRLLDGTTTAPVSTVAPVADGFQNREQERAQLLALLRAPGSDVILTVGDDGVGKTRLVHKVLDLLEPEAQIDRYEVYPTRAFGAGDFITSLEQRITAPTGPAGPQYRPMDPVMVKLRVLLETPAPKPVIVAVDGAEHLLDPRSHQIMDDDLDDVLQLLGGRRAHRPSQPIKVLLISRIRPQPTEHNSWALDASSLPVVKGLGPEPFTRFLKGLDQGGVYFGDAQPEQFAELHALTDGSPRAGELIYAMYDLTEHGPRLQQLRQHLPNGGPEHVRRRLMERLIGGLDSDRQRTAAQVVAAFGFPVPPAYVAALVGRDVDRVTNTLKQLVRLKILRQASEDRYFAPPPDDEYILNGLPPDAGDGRSRRALYQKAANHLRDQRPTTVTSIADLTLHRYEIDLLIRAEDYDGAFTLITEVDRRYLDRWGFSSLLTWQREELQRHLTDERQRIYNLDGIGYSFRSRNKLDQARAAYAEELDLARRLNDPGLLKPVLVSLAGVHHQDLKFPAAEAYYREALELAERHRERKATVKPLIGLSECDRHHGNLPQSVERLERALELARELMPDAVPDVLVQLGRRHLDLGRHSAARGYLDEAGGLLSTGGKPLIVCEHADAVADLLLNVGDIAAAIDAATEVERRAAYLGEPNTLRKARTTLAFAYAAGGHWSAATDMIDRMRRYRTKRHALIALALLGYLQVRGKDTWGAPETFRELREESFWRCRDDELDYAAFDMQGFAVCGLHLCDNVPLDTALEAFDQARAITRTAVGPIRRLRKMLEDLQRCGPAGALRTAIERATAGVDIDGVTS